MGGPGGGRRRWPRRWPTRVVVAVVLVTIDAAVVKKKNNTYLPSGHIHIDMQRVGSLLKADQRFDGRQLFPL